MRELQSTGYEPDGLVFTEDELRYILEQNFDFGKGQSLPDRIEIFGLPVRVRE